MSACEFSAAPVDQNAKREGVARLLAVLLALGIALMFCASSPPQASAVRTLGYHPGSFEDPARSPWTSAILQQGGSKWVRIPIFWFQLEPTAPSGGTRSYQWSTPGYNYDHDIAAARAAGQKILLVPSGSPSWVSGCATNVNAYCPPTSAHVLDWKVLLQQLIGRYHPDAIELWNEPNNPTFGGMTASTYFNRLFSPGYTAVRNSYYPNTQILAPATSSAGMAPGWQGFLSNFVNLAKVQAKDWAISQHLYPAETQSTGVLNTLKQVYSYAKGLAVANGIGGGAVWPTEYGVSRQYVSASDQGWILPRVYCYTNSPGMVYRLWEADDLSLPGFGVIDNPLPPAYTELQSAAINGCGPYL